MRFTLLIVTVCLFCNCTNSPEEASKFTAGICQRSAFISNPESDIREIWSVYLDSGDFYSDTAGHPDYDFYVHLNSSLEFDSVDVMAFNNQEIADKMKEIFEDLRYKKDDGVKDCEHYFLPFLVDAETKNFIFPDSPRFWDTIPLEPL